MASGRTNADGDKGSFFAEGRLSSDALSVSVRGAGLLDRPVRAEAARALHVRTSPARYGRRESTLLDTRVRDTGEIGTDALTLTWKDGVLPSLMADVAHALKLHRLEARLHSLLVYGRGQFFKPHQDTETQPGMVATLVLVWPCAHIGGELRVRHGDRQACFASQHLETNAIRWFAFYADCRHEVLPVTEGWRIVLTFDLVVPVGPHLPHLSVPSPLLEALRTHFFPPDGTSTRPWVYLLDHEYTQHGLRWALLKGEDRLRVSTLRTAAESLGLIARLALAEIHQQWTASPDYPNYGKRRGHSGNPQADELIDESIALDYWVGGDDRPLRRDTLHVRSSDVDSFTDTDASFLVDEEYEGYMGNYGETLAYWYRRAAVVIQTPLAAEASRFVTEFDAALADALLLARDGRSVELAQRLQAAAPELRARGRERGRALLRPYAELAVALPDAAHARGLCESFAWASLKPSNAAALAALARRWGTTWMKDMLAAWAQASPRWDGYASFVQTEREAPLWPRPLPKFVRACIRARLQGEVIDAMLEQCLSALIHHDATLARRAPAVRHATLQRRLKAACELVSALCLDPTRAAGRLDALLGHVRAQAGLYPLRSLRPLLEVLSSGAAAPAQAKALGAAVVDDLQQALGEPEPSPDDYGVHDIEWTCRCADCKLVIAWATSPDAQPLTLAMAETRRSHVQSQLQDADAPFGFETVRKGSPHKLVIRKPLDLRAQRSARRAAWAVDLAALARWRHDPWARRARSRTREA